MANFSRAERRRAEREAQKKTKTYNLTQEQLEQAVRDAVQSRVEDIRKQATEDGVTSALTLMFALPLKVLMDYYWKKSYAKRLPKFTEHLLEYYERWQSGELDMDKLKEDLWEYGGVRLEESE